MYNTNIIKHKNMKHFIHISIGISLISISLIFLIGCGDNSKSVNKSNNDKAVSNQNIPESYMVEKKNRFDYQPGLECSAFASAYLLRHYDTEADGISLFKDFPGKLPEGGVKPTGIVSFFELRGYEAKYICNGTIDDIKLELNKGAPVIVFIHVEEPYASPHNTHYVPIVGYDNKYFYFAESLDYLANCKEETGVNYNRKTEIDKFERLWKNIDNTWDKPYFSIASGEKY